MSEKQDLTLKSLVGVLEQKRDEIKLQIHLAEKDAQDEWERLEGEWSTFQQKVERIGHVATDATEHVVDAAEKLGTSIREGYERVLNSLK